MSATDKLPVPKTNRATFLIVAVVFVLIVIGLMTPLYLQNRVNALYSKSYALSSEIVFLKRDILMLDLKINQYSSLEHLCSFADSVGLGLNGVPVKVMDVGGAGVQ